MDVDDDDELDGEGGFEAELAMLEEVEADMRSIGEGPEAVSTSTRWSRPPVPSFDATTDALVFQQFDIDYHTGIVTGQFVVSASATMLKVQIDTGTVNSVERHSHVL